MKNVTEGSTSWARGAPPNLNGPWQDAIISIAESGDARFIEILREHVDRGVIRSDRANAALVVRHAD